MRGVALLPFAAVGGLAAGILVAEPLGEATVRPLVLAAMGTTGMAVLLLVGTPTRFAARVGLAAALLGGTAVGVARGGAVALDTGPGSVAALIGQEASLAGVALDDPRPREDRQQVVLHRVRTSDESRGLTGRVLVWLPRGIAISAGDELRITARLEQPEDFEGFAYREYLARQGIAAIGRAHDATVTPGAGPEAVLAAVRGGLRDGLNRIVPEPEAALGAGILLGVRSGIAPEIDDAFADAGLTHVVAISGWNIAIVAGVVAALVAPLGRRRAGRWASTLVGVAAVGGYVLLTGASPSVVRAALMAAAMLLVRLGGSRAHAASALAAAAGVMLLAAPAVLWDVGFQLSLLATAGLIWFGGPIEARLHGLPGWLREPIALTLAAQLTTLPILLVTFERLSLVAPLANVAVVPIVPLAMLASGLAAVAGALAGVVWVPILIDAAGWLVGGAAWLSLRLMIEAGTAFAGLPAAAVDVGLPGPLAVAWYPCLALAWWATRSTASRRTGVVLGAASSPGPVRLLVLRLGHFLGIAGRPLPVAAVLVAVLAATSLGARPDGRLHLHALDIGQGDAILVRSPDGVTVLIDGGPDPELTLRELGGTIGWSERRIDIMVLSHPHQDHVAGLVEALRRHRVGLVLHAGIPFENAAYDQLLVDAQRRGVPVALARAGQLIAIGSHAVLEIIHPTQEDADRPLPEGDINNGSVVAILRHGAFSALLTGDAEAPIEQALLARGLVPDVDVLKVGHHGSHSSTTPAFLGAAAPEVAIISSGVGNEYGHPAPETLAALASRPGLSTLRTDTDGHIEIVSDGRAYVSRTVRSTTAHADDGAPPVGGVPGSIGSWPFQTSRPPVACSTTSSCRAASSSIPRASGAWPPPRPAWWRTPGFRSTSTSSRRRRCSTTSTRCARGATAGSMASSGRGCSPRWATTSSRSRSPPTRSAACSTMSGSRSAGRRSSSRSPTATWGRSS